MVLAGKPRAPIRREACDRMCARRTSGGCPAVRRPYACGPRRQRDPWRPMAPTGIDARSFVALKPLPPARYSRVVAPRANAPAPRVAGKPVGLRLSGPAFVSSKRNTFSTLRAVSTGGGGTDALCQRRQRRAPRPLLLSPSSSKTSPPPRPSARPAPRAGACLPVPWPAGPWGRVGRDSSPGQDPGQQAKRCRPLSPAREAEVPAVHSVA